MPKKIDKTIDKIRSYKKVSMSTKNGQRWVTLKNHLGFFTDDELVDYLLDLADSMIDREGKNSYGNVESYKVQCIQENDVQSNFVHSVDSRILHSNILRRSSRKLNVDDFSKSACYEKLKNVPSSLHNVEKSNQQEYKAYSKSCQGITKTKRHKNRSKCHRDKHKKTKHQKIKDGNISTTTENKVTQRMTLKHDLENDSIKQCLDLTDENTINKKVDQFCEGLKNLNGSNMVESPLNENLENNLQCELETSKMMRCSNKKKESQNILQPSELKQSTVNVVKITKNFLENKEIASCEKLSDTLLNNKQESSKFDFSKESDQVHSIDQISSVYANDDENSKENTESTSNFDVPVTSQNDLTPYTHIDIINSTLVDVKAVHNSKNSEVNIDVLSSAIEVCKNCDVKHFQDVCPLIKPDHIIEDSISLSNWINKHKNNSEVAKVIDSNDPMSKGYSNGTNYIFEFNKEIVKQYKAKCDIQHEEKQENIHPNWPLFSRDSLPICLELKISNMDHGLGVFVKNLVPMYTQFGPLIGQSVQQMDIPDDYSMKHIWEVSTSDKTQYISSTNPLASNWVRYIRPADTEDSKTVNIVKKNGQLFFITCKTLMVGTELIYWLDSQSNSWTKKHKMDKMNCGGCNLKFSHPIYYRLHCCIFHDTNYSLTIRKYHCKVCGTAVLGKDNIMKHAAQFHAGRGAYQCQYCKKFFLRLNYLEMHRTYGCSKNPLRSRPLCDFCGRKFCQPQKLKVHIKRMHSDTSEVLEEFQCKLCSKLLGSRAALARHMKEVHHKDVVGAAACDRCGKTFQNKSNLKIHMLTHSGVKPFKCKENQCKAAFTTKQCLQFHYKKVHGLNDEMMPKIERSIAYTFDAYSGGLVEDLGRGKIPKFNSDEKEQCDSSFDLEDDCSEQSQDTVILKSSPSLETRNRRAIKELNFNDKDKLGVVDSSTESSEMDLDTRQAECTTDEIHKVNKKWTSKLDIKSASTLAPETFNIDSIQNNGPESDDVPSSYQMSTNDEKLETTTLCKRQESYNASLLVEAALDAAERDIGVVSIPPLEDNEQGNTDLYSVPNELGFKSVDYQVAHEATAGNIESHVHDELVMSSTVIPNSRQAVCISSQYRSTGYVSTPNRLHSIEQYLEQEILTSRYDESSHIHSNNDSQMQSQPHRLIIDPASGDESDSAVQNLSLPVKDKSIQQMETSKYNYEPDYNSVNRVKFEPLVVQSAREQGLDMSARGFQQTSGPQIQNSNHLHHYHHHNHHHHHPYKMDENERQGVDLSISGSCVSPSYATIYPPYSHVDVPRVVNLEPTSRSHQIHTSVSRIISSPLPETFLTSLSSDSAEVRIPPPSASPMPTYNTTTCTIGTAYHTPRPFYNYCNYY